MALYRFKAETIIEEGRTSRQNIDEIRSWLKTTKIPSLKDEFIVLFLVSCNDDVEASQRKIQTHFDIKLRSPELFHCKEIDGANMAKVREVAMSVVVPKRQNNAIIHFSRLLDTNYKKCVLTEVFKQGLMAAHLSVTQYPPESMIVIIDMEGVGFMHLTCVKLSVLKTLVDYVQDAMPLKIAKIHILNCTYVVDKVLTMAKHFMRPELKEAIQTHPVGMPLKEFQDKWIPAEYLPKEYDGDLPGYLDLRDKFVEEAREMRSLFEAEEKLMESYRAIH